MKDWQATVLFVVGVLGALLLLFASSLHLSISPEAAAPVGVILTYVLGSKAREKSDKKDEDEKHE